MPLQFQLALITFWLAYSVTAMMTPPTKNIVLIGGGHAHVQVIKALNVNTRPSNVKVTLIDIQSAASYSGMVPACLSKLYTLPQVQIQIEPLAEWAGIDFVQGKVVGMSLEDEEKKTVQVEVNNSENGEVVTKEVPFDAISVDIGSTTRDFNRIPGARQYCISTRPISDLVVKIQKEEELLKERLQSGTFKAAHFVVVGGGPAGIELSLAIRARFNDMLDSNLSITLIDSSDGLLLRETPACRKALENVMSKYKIDVRFSFLVDEVTSSHVNVHSSKDQSSREKIPYTHIIWATGAEAHDLSWSLNKQCGLAVSETRGWIQVNSYLQSLSHPYIFAAGDCCEIVSDKKSPPKAGVYAVRSGPILIENLSRFVGASECAQQLAPYHPQDDFLKLLMCGDGTALGFRFGIPLYGKWVWKLKDFIDVMFMDLFDVNKLPKLDEKKDEYDTSQYDASIKRPPPLVADDAAKLLLRTDDEVDFHRAWDVLRDMMADDKYKEEVLDIARLALDKQRSEIV